MDWPLSAASLAIIWLIGSHKRWAWLLSAGLALCWVGYFATTHQWGLLASDVIACAIALRNYHRWEPAKHA